MHFVSLRLHNYRNYQEEKWLPTPRVNILYGENGQGKTNVLEAFQVLILGRSSRVRKEGELIYFGSEGFSLEGEVSIGNRNIALYLGLHGGKKKHLLNGIPIDQAVVLSERPGVVFFSPNDLSLVQGPPAVRRRFLDQLLAQVYPGYRDSFQRYWRGLAQRNALLREIKGRRASSNLLEIWDEDLAIAGEKVMAWRMKATRELELCADRFHANIALTNAGMTYRPGVGKHNWEDGFNLRGTWARSIHEDIARGTTSFGPQRDDLALTVNGLDAQCFASQGQQRSMALAMRLAEIDFLENKFGRRPILLLDDVFSELDQHRRRRLVTMLEEGVGQVFLTCTDLGQIPEEISTKGVGFLVKGGRIESGMQDKGR